MAKAGKSMALTSHHLCVILGMSRVAELDGRKPRVTLSKHEAKRVRKEDGQTRAEAEKEGVVRLLGNCLLSWQCGISCLLTIIWRKARVS